MSSWLHPRRDERAASAFVDLASALDAGLPPQHFGGDPADGQAVLVRALERRGVALSPMDVTVLTTAFAAGIGSTALRRGAEQREQRAQFGRSVLGGLRYPLVLLALSVVVAFVASALGARWLPWTVLGVLATAALLLAATLRLVRSGSPRALRLPVLGPLVRDLAELPYLEVLHGLYGAGVPIREAHAEAVAAAPPSAIRERLQLADRHVQQGRPIREALAETLAVDGETLHLLALGEVAGNLEDALARAVRRRRDTAQRRALAIGKGLAMVAYALGVAVSAAVILQFYSAYFGALRGLR